MKINEPNLDNNLDNDADWVQIIFHPHYVQTERVSVIVQITVHEELCTLQRKLTSTVTV